MNERGHGKDSTGEAFITLTFIFTSSNILLCCLVNCRDLDDDDDDGGHGDRDERPFMYKGWAKSTFDLPFDLCSYVFVGSLADAGSKLWPQDLAIVMNGSL